MEKISKDDPRFTAKALGEQSEELENVEITNEDLKEFEETLALAKELEHELGNSESEETLSEDQISDLGKRFEERDSRWKLLMFPVWAYNVAACLAIGAVGVVMYNDAGLFEQEPRRPAPVDTVAEAGQAFVGEDEAQSSPGSVDQLGKGESSRDNRVKATSEIKLTTEELTKDLSAVPVGGTVYSEERVESSKMRLDNTRYFEDVRPAQLVEPPIIVLNQNTELKLKSNSVSSGRFENDDQAKKERLPELVLAGESLPKIVPSAFAESEEAFELSPFSVDANETYVATSTLAGTRLQARLSDEQGLTVAESVGQPITVLTSDFLEDVGKGGSVRLNFTNAPETKKNVVVRRLRSATQQLSVGISPPPANREGYDHIEENDFRSVMDNPLSTFSIDVDTASYSNMRRMIEGGVRPIPDAIRIEELINYFKYDYSEPTGETPFSVNIESASAPWKSEHQLVRIGLKGKTIAQDERPAANLVFLVDVSGSMGQQNKLPLAQDALKLLVDQMGSDDRIAIVVYAGSSGLVLPSTTANNQETIQHAIDNLRSGGSTNGGAGIELAYKIATEKFIDGGINRVVLCTDGDFNVGVTDDGSLVRLIEEKAKSGVFFSAIGFGNGNYQDGKMEQLSNKGNGNYAYIDGKKEARKVFVDDMLGTLHTIAKDVKIQVDFNPTEVTAYRLIGYVNRKLAKEDFNDDKKDAGEIGAGHTVTALYEVVPAGVEFDVKDVDASKYQRPATKTTGSEEWLTVKLRYKAPDEDVSQLVDFPYTGNAEREFKNASPDFRFASSVAGFGMLLRDSAYKGNLKMDDLIESARNARSKDLNGSRSEFVELVRKAKALIPEVSKLSPFPNTGTPYIVRNGDTLSGIAKKFDSRVNWIQEVNQIESPRHLQAGRNLFIPQEKSGR